MSMTSKEIRIAAYDELVQETKNRLTAIETAKDKLEIKKMKKRILNDTNYFIGKAEDTEGYSELARQVDEEIKDLNAEYNLLDQRLFKLIETQQRYVKD